MGAEGHELPREPARKSGQDWAQGWPRAADIRETEALRAAGLDRGEKVVEYTYIVRLY